jgi:hypothetical protein
MSTGAGDREITGKLQRALNKKPGSGIIRIKE